MQAVAKQATTHVLEAMAKRLNAELDPGVLKIKYVGTEEDAPLSQKARVRFTWSLLGGQAPQVVFLYRAIASGLQVPWLVKTPLLAACLPAAVASRRLLPAMQKHGEVRCHALGTPKEKDAFETAFVARNGRRAEVMLCAHIKGDTWLCHFGGAPSINALEKLEVSTGPPAKQPRLNGPVHRLQPLAGKPLHQVLAVAHFRAEVAKAELEGRPVNLEVAEEKLEKNAFEWKGKPKHVLVSWSHRTPEGSWRAEISDASWKSLCA